MLLLTPASQAQWQADVRMTNDPGTSFTAGTSTSSIASNGSFVHVVWWDNRNTDWEIYYKRSTDNGTSWSSDIRLTNVAGNSYVPTVAVSGSVVHVVWQDQRDGNREIYYKRSTDGGVTWGSDTRLTNDPATSESPSVAVSGQTIHIAWYDRRDGDEEEYYKRSTDGGVSWEADTRLTDDPISTWDPSISVSGQVVHVVWQDSRSGPNKVGYRRSTDGGANWNTDTVLGNRPGGTYSPCISASGQTLIVVWEDHSTFNSEVYYKRSTDGGVSWGGDIRLTNDTATSGYPYVCVSGQYVHVAYWDNRDGNFEIYYNQSTDVGITWTSDTRLTNSPGSSEAATISTSGSIVHVAWYDGRDGNWEIYYKRNPTGNPVGITKNNSGIPEEFSLGQNYPNPFNPETNFKFSLPKSSWVSIKIYDITGRVVDIIANNELRSAGVYEVNYNASGLSSGVYFYTVRAGEYSETKKMVLTK